MTITTIAPLHGYMVMDELRSVNPGRQYPLTFNSTDVRALVGVPFGPYAISAFYGKSAAGGITASPSNASTLSDSTSAGTAVCTPGVSAAGGSTPYTYAWTITSNPGGCTIGPSSAATINVSHAYAASSSGKVVAVMSCLVTDAIGRTYTAAGVTATLEWSRGILRAVGNDASTERDSSNGSGTARCAPSVTVTSGTGPYTYTWSVDAKTGGCTFGSNGTAGYEVLRAYNKNTSGAASATLSCLITDSLGQRYNVTNITATLTWDGIQ